METVQEQNKIFSSIIKEVLSNSDSQIDWRELLESWKNGNLTSVVDELLSKPNNFYIVAKFATLLNKADQKIYLRILWNKQ